MSRYVDYELEDDELAEAAFLPKSRVSGKRKASTKKASYESSVDVQFWLREQERESANVKPPFHPTFLASLRDAPWILSSLTLFYEQNFITDVLHVIKSGKEATVYCCAADPSTGMEYLAAKIYRPRMFRSLKNDAVYRKNRLQRDKQGKVLHDKTQLSGITNENEKGRAARVSSWIDYEFATQQLLYDAGASVPRPVAHEGNAVLMEYIGEVGDAAPLLREIVLEREEAQALFESIIKNIELWLSQSRIHGDLSEYNMLYWQGAVTIIDFAQAVDPCLSQDVFPLLLRDIQRVCRYFARYGVESDPFAIATEMWTGYLGEFV